MTDREGVADYTFLEHEIRDGELRDEYLASIQDDLIPMIAAWLTGEPVTSASDRILAETELLEEQFVTRYQRCEGPKRQMCPTVAGMTISCGECKRFAIGRKVDTNALCEFATEWAWPAFADNFETWRENK